jgi:sporulation protein YlmC with PRC-barrel domain
MRRIVPLLAASILAAFALPALSQARDEGEAPAFLTKRGTDHWFFSDFIGSQVYDTNGEEIGEVDELVIDRNGAVVAVVIGTGGFLAMGEKDIAVPISAVMLVMRDGHPLVVARYTRNELEQAPAFSKDPG